MLRIWWQMYIRNLREITFRLTNVIPERIIFVSRGITVVCKKMGMWNASVQLLFVLGDHPSHFGYQRLWGTVGWGIFAIISGLLVDEFSRGLAQKDYTVVFYLMLIMLLSDVIVSSRLKVSDKFSFRCVMYWYCPVLRLYSVDVRWMNRYGVWVELYW